MWENNFQEQRKKEGKRLQTKKERYNLSKKSNFTYFCLAFYRSRMGDLGDTADYQSVFNKDTFVNEVRISRFFLAINI